jgi:hypothetical protein
MLVSLWASTFRPDSQFNLIDRQTSRIDAQRALTKATTNEMWTEKCAQKMPGQEL